MKSDHYLCILTILGVVSCLLIAGCTQSQGSTSSTTTYQAQSLPILQAPYDNMDQYFPMKVGNEWFYIVDVKEGGAVGYKETPLFIRRDGFYPQNKGNSLVIRIEKEVDIQCNTQYPGSLKLQIIKDDFDLFKYDKEIFWIKNTLSSPNNYMITQATTIEDHYGRDSCAEKILFFADKANTEMSKYRSKDKLMYLGKEKINYKYQLIDCIHFKRTVNSGEQSLSSLGKNFTEDSWYAPDKGLIRMEQKIAGKTSMVWELEKFKPA